MPYLQGVHDLSSKLVAQQCCPEYVVWYVSGNELLHEWCDHEGVVVASSSTATCVPCSVHSTTPPHRQCNLRNAQLQLTTAQPDVATHTMHTDTTYPGFKVRTSCFSLLDLDMGRSPSTGRLQNMYVNMTNLQHATRCHCLRMGEEHLVFCAQYCYSCADLLLGSVYQTHCFFPLSVCLLPLAMQ